MLHLELFILLRRSTWITNKTKNIILNENNIIATKKYILYTSNRKGGRT